MPRPDVRADFLGFSGGSLVWTIYAGVKDEDDGGGEVVSSATEKKRQVLCDQSLVLQQLYDPKQRPEEEKKKQIVKHTSFGERQTHAVSPFDTILSSSCSDAVCTLGVVFLAPGGQTRG